MHAPSRLVRGCGRPQTAAYVEDAPEVSGLRIVLPGDHGQLLGVETEAMNLKVNEKRPRVMTVIVHLALYAFMLLMVSAAFGESLTGRWAALGKVMDNGEQQKTILDLAQTGSDLMGRMTALGFEVDVRGKVTGNHFDLFAWDDKDPFVVGDPVNGELHGTQWGGAFVAKPATPAAEFPKLPYLQSPAFSARVPSHGVLLLRVSAK
jgi:hypothetical protein